MNRKIESNKARFEKPKKIENPPTEWNKQVLSGKFRYLLAHADDGVIWGKVDGDKLALSSDANAYPEVSPKLRLETLRELHLFGPQTEWFLWRTDTGWQARTILDGEGDPVEYYDECNILWGTGAVGDPKPPFTLVAEADTGIRHTPPIALVKRHSLRLRVRHYLAEDENGAVYVKLSRLVNLENGDKA